MTLRIGILVAMFALGGIACGDDGGGSSGTGGTAGTAAGAAGTAAGTTAGTAAGTTAGTAAGTEAGTTAGSGDGDGADTVAIDACKALIPADSANPECAACACEMCTDLAASCNGDPLCLAVTTCTNANLAAGTCGSMSCYYDVSDTAGMGPCASEIHSAGANMEGADSMAVLGGACALPDPTANACANSSLLGECLHTTTAGEPSICAACLSYPAAP